MAALTPKQFASVVAHELGHLSGNHSRFSGWIYRVRRTWDRLLDQLLARSVFGTRLFTAFFRRYVPYFSAYSFVLARADEYVADACAAEQTSRADAVQALLRLEVASNYMREEFWPKVYDPSAAGPVPPREVLSRFSEEFPAALGGKNSGKWLRAELSEPTGYVDTHPSLADRLAALGVQATQLDAMLAQGRSLALKSSTPGDAEGTEQTADKYYLGESWARLIDALNSRWHKEVTPEWQQRTQNISAMRSRLEELKDLSTEGELSSEDIVERGLIAYQILPESEALGPLQQAILKCPDRPGLQMSYSMALMQTDRGEEAVPHLEKAMELDFELIPSACRHLIRHFSQHGDTTRAAMYRSRLEAHIELLVDTSETRGSVTHRDTLEVADVPPDARQQLAAQFQEIAEISAAYILKKVVPELPAASFLVLAVEPKYRWYKSYDKDYTTVLSTNLTQVLQSSIPLTLVVIGSDKRKLRRKVRKLRAARIFP